MYVYICSSPNSNDIPRWQKVIMMTSGRIFKKKILCIRFTFSCSVKSIRFMYFATERFFKCPIKLFSRTIENLQWLHFCVLPRVAFQMSSQITPLNRWKVTLVAFVLFLSRVSPQMVREGKFQVTLVLFVWSFRGFQMSPQTTCFSTCMVALVASGQFFPRGSFKVYPKMTRIRRCVVTLVAFVWFSPWMNYQMRPQTTCISGCKITLVAFVRFFSGVYFQMYPQFTCIDSWTVTLVAFVFFFSGMSFEVSPQIVYL